VTTRVLIDSAPRLEIVESVGDGSGAGFEVTGLQSVGRAVSSLGTGQENASLSVVIANSRGEHTARFADPPLRRRTIVEVDGDAYFSGQLMRVRMGSEIELVLES
jgi:hypothetical protein